MTLPVRFVLAVALCAVGTVACSADEAAAPAPAPSPPTATTSTAREAGVQTRTPPTTTSTPTPIPTPPPHPVSIEALAQQAYDGRNLQIGEVLDANDAYTRYFVTYASGDLTISGIMNIPVGAGPFPTLVLAHGYIDPAIYTNGRGMMREQDYLARAGYAVLHTDYRNHAESSDDPNAELELRLGYTKDVITAVLAIKASGHPQLDPERVGLMGRSMGGGVAYNALVASPGLVDAAVVYAPVSSSTADNFNRWTRADPGADGVSDAIIAAYGAPEASPEFWQDVSPVTYFDRITEPILIQHGTADESCPVAWSQQTLAALQAADADAELITYDAEPHAFEAVWPLSMERTVAFFTEHLRA